MGERRFLKDMFIGRHFYYGASLCVLMLLVSFFFPDTGFISYGIAIAFPVLVLIDFAILFFSARSFHVRRNLPARLSNGEENPVSWTLKNPFPFQVQVKLIDEWPPQLQIRHQIFRMSLRRRERKKIRWQLRPVTRGQYQFGNIHLFATTPLALIERRFTIPAQQTVPCYPSLIRLNNYAIRSRAIIQDEHGNVRMRRIGQSMEFEQIKEYIRGDDIRTVNWKASARRASLMVNQYAQERSQQVYCIIDKGRLMKMPFDGMTLLDHAINSALILSSVCLSNRDRTGLITFSNQMDTLLAADNRPKQMGAIMEALYDQETGFLESDFERLYHTVRSHIRNRSLLILFTNFESVSGLNRQIDFIRALSRYHLLLVIFFENAEMKALIKVPATTVEEVYTKSIAGKFSLEKKLIAAELSKFGIPTILAKPNELTIKTVNKYLELKVKSAL